MFFYPPKLVLSHGNSIWINIRQDHMDMKMGEIFLLGQAR